MFLACSGADFLLAYFRRAVIPAHAMNGNSGRAAGRERDFAGLAAIRTIILTVGGKADVLLSLAIATVAVAFAFDFGFIARRTACIGHGRLHFHYSPRAHGRQDGVTEA